MLNNVLKTVNQLKAMIEPMLKFPQAPAAPQGPSRPMKFPYTFSAKIAQFPYKFYFDNNWMYRCYCYAFIGSIPVFMYISRLSNSPANKKKWKELRHKEHEEHKHRFD